MKDFLKTFQLLTDDEIERCMQLATSRSLEKGAYFISEGKICNEVAFVRSGIFRSYHTSEAGDELTYCILFPGQFITAYSSFISGKKTAENIQAITPAELLILPKHVIEQLVDTSNNWLRFMKVMAEQQYMELENRVFQLQRDTARQRYLDLLQHYPQYVREIPLQYLASYLGISQRHLSRLRKEISY
jgi:CRP-like cAMP-binding protein